MDLPGLIRITEADENLAKDVAFMMGESFLEEKWTATLLSSLHDINASPERILEISRLLMFHEFMVGSSFGNCYTLPDISASAGAYLKSDLGNRVWSDLEEIAFDKLSRDYLTKQETETLLKQQEKMKGITVFNWEEEYSKGNDFIHFYVLGVDPKKRGQGGFRRLVEPFFDYADEHGIECYLETYSIPLEQLYQHFGFETVHIFRDPSFKIEERCMVRKPQA